MDITEASELTYAWLQALDPTHQERQELLDGGVGKNAVRSLYPYDFEALLPAIAARWDDVSPVIPANVKAVVSAQGSALLAPLELLPEAAREVYTAYWWSGRTENEVNLAQELVRLALGEPLSLNEANMCVTSLHCSWYLMAHLDYLPPAQQAKVREVMAWCGEHLLKLFGQHADEMTS